MGKHGHILLLFLLAIAVILGAFFAAQAIRESSMAQEIVEQFGILGITAIAFVAGMNIFVPIHVATFTPIFLSAGFSMPVIILTMVIGTTIADTISYLFGHWGKHKTHTKYKGFYARLYSFKEKHHMLILPAIFFYSAFVPFPNELMLVPLGLMGFRFSVLLSPLVLGTLINHTIFSFGFTSIFEFFF